MNEGIARKETKSLADLKADVIKARTEAEALRAPLDQLIVERDQQIRVIEEKFFQENKDLIAKIDAADTQASRLESVLRTAIIDAYKANIETAKATGQDIEKVSKQFGDGLSVRNSEKVEYVEADAVTWAKENAQYLIRTSVDRKLFEAAMKQLEQTPAFITITKTPSAVIKF